MPELRFGDRPTARVGGAGGRFGSRFRGEGPRDGMRLLTACAVHGNAALHRELRE